MKSKLPNKAVRATDAVREIAAIELDSIYGGRAAPGPGILITAGGRSGILITSGGRSGILITTGG